MIALLLALACGPAAYTAPEPTPVVVQIGDGRIETVADGYTEWWGDYHAAAEGAWAVWDTDGNLLASGNVCAPPELIEPQIMVNPVSDDTRRHVSYAAPFEQPYKPFGVEIR